MPQNPSQREKEKNDCFRCGLNHDKREQCPAHGKKCSKCFKLHHFARVCKSKPEKEVNYVEENSSDDDFYVGSIETVMLLMQANGMKESQFIRN